ncbi:MAG: RrF2 family transcriptional regulator [Anaerolineales bacterium]
MMRINRRVDYAIRVLIALAKQPAGARLSTRTIQKTMWIPRAFLSRIIAELSKAKIIDTFPGPNGGVQLLRDPREINIRLIWEVMDKPLVISDCLENPEECPLNFGCPVNACWGRIQALVLREMEMTTIAELARKVRDAELVGVAV